MTQAEQMEMEAKKFLARNSNELDMSMRRVSWGPHSNVKSYIDEGKNAPIFSFVLENDTATDQMIILGGKGTMYGSTTEGVRRLKTEVAGLETAILLTDGTLVAGVSPRLGLLARTDSATRRIEDFVNYVTGNPSTLLELKFESSIYSTNAPETTNFNQQVKAVFTSPFHAPVVTAELSLRDYRDDKVQSAQYLAVPLFKEGKNVILSDQNFLVLGIRANTRLNISIPVGAQMSNAQDLHRTNNRGRAAMFPIVGSASNSCNC